MSVELIIAIFEGNEAAAAEVLATTKSRAKEGALKLKGAVAIVKDKESKITVTEVGDVDAKHGAVLGAITGGLIGLIGGPIGLVVGAATGAAAGGATAKIADYGISNDTIEGVEKGLTPGSSAALVYAELKWGDKAAEKLKQAGAQVTRVPLNDNMLRTYGQDMVQ